MRPICRERAGFLVFLVRVAPIFTLAELRRGKQLWSVRRPIVMSPPRCPYCDQPVSTPAVLKAVLPSAIRCPHCGRRLRVRNIGLLFAGYIAALAVVIVLYFYAHRLHVLSRVQRLIAAVALLAGVEFVASFSVARLGRFEKWDEHA